ncbi:MAG: GAF domain-containing protein, partial [Anaerolineae bacterium]|nr:GAF domain-containing protein [Anaerolineae bacterium]
RLKRDLRQAQQELRASEEHYRGITETALVGVSISAPDETITFTNRALAEMLGYTHDELTGMSIAQLTTPEEFGLFQERTERRRAGLRDQYETVLYRKDGHPINTLISASPLRDADGQFHSTLAVITDITERKRAERALAWEAGVNAAVAELSRALISPLSLEEMSDLFLEHAKRLTDSVHGFVGYIDPQTGFLLSPTLTRDIWDTCEMPQKTFVFETFKGLWGWVLNQRRPMMTNAPHADARSTGVPEGHIPIERFVSAPALIGENLVGQIALANATRAYTKEDLLLVERLASLYAIAIMRRQAQIDLEQSEEKFRQLAENIREVFWITTPNNDRILYISPAYADVWGGDVADLYARPELWTQAIHPEDRERVIAANVKQVRGDYDEEYRIVRSDGMVRWIRARAFPVRDERGEVYRIAGISEDITERKRAEERLLRYAEEQAALYTVASTISTQLDPDELLSLVLDTVLPVIDSGAGWVLIPGPTLDDTPRVAAWRGVPHAFVEAEASSALKDCTQCAALVATTQTVAGLHPIAECPRLQANQLEWACGKQHIGIPLSAGDEVLGILEIVWNANRPHTDADTALLLAIGRQVGLALRNAQLYQAARQVDRLRVLNELDRELAATLDPETVAEVTLRQIATAIDAQLGMLFLMPVDGRNYPTRLFNLKTGWRGLNLADSVQENPYVQSILQALADNREIVDLSGEDLAAASPGHQHIDAWGPGLALPVWDNEQLAAALLLSSRPGGRPFTDEDRALARAAANRAAQAIRNARLYRASQRRGDRLATLNIITNAAVSSLEIDSVLKRVLELTCDALDVAEGSILLQDPESGTLRFVVTLESTGVDLHGLELQPGQGVAGWVAQHGQALCVNDVAQDPRWYRGIDAQTHFETRSLCCAPLRHQDEVTGVIQVVNKRAGMFTEEDVKLLDSVASIAAVALQNARLYTAARERAEELALLNEIGMALTATLNRAAVVDAALAQIQRLFHAEGVALLQPKADAAGLCFVRAISGKRPLDVTDAVQQGKCAALWALENRQALLIEDARGDAHGPACMEPFLDCEGRALMTVPLLSPKQATGVIEVVSRHEGLYTTNDINTLQAIASTLTVALENAHLYEEVKGLLLERERAQAQLIHAEKMSALGRLVASIAHEINNPLQSVQGCLTLVEEELETDQRQDKMERYLNIATVEIDRISTIVRRMRDFYRPAREGLQSTNLHEVLEGVLALTGKQLQHSQVEVERDWAAALPMVQANADHLKQVFLNLVINAIDAMPAGGTIRISTALEQLDRPDAPSPAPVVRVAFADSGFGMSPETLAHVFEPFFTTKEHGSGLGLSISYGIIQSHNGKISVESQEGKGTTFTIILPVEASAETNTQGSA